ncbi:Rieske 2Fe-2S domain-containing protein [Variovorax boronicumulans]
MTEPTARTMIGLPSVQAIHPPAGEHHAFPQEVRKPYLLARSASGDTRPVLPYSNGWFAVCFSHEVKPGGVHVVPFMGQDLVVYRTQSGLARVVDPYCPHAGAHLGHGGKIDGENLVCPFHGLAFGTDGGCVRACPGQTPPRAALTSRYMREQNGTILVWRHSEDRPPEWEIPAMDLSDRLSPQFGAHELDGYGDSMGENGMDPTHFGWLHGFTDTEITHEIEGHTLVATINARWKGQRFRSRLTNYGLGHACGENEMPDLGVHVVTQAYATPIAPLRWTFRWIDNPSVARIDRLPAPLRRLAYRVLNPLAHRWLISVVNDDFTIWNARTHLKHPKLMPGERTLAAFRRWSEQFYPPTQTADAEAGPAPRTSTGR